jgi:hypothetical protein
VQNDLTQKLLDLENHSQNILDEITSLRYRLDIFPEKDLKLSQIIEREFENEVTLKPEIDFRYLYLVMENKIQVFDKDSFKPIWNRDLPEKIIYTKLLGSNRYLIQTKKSGLFCLDRAKGDLIWQKDFSLPLADYDKLLEIRLNRYKSLDSSIIVLCEENIMSVVDIITGDEIFYLETKDKINFISDFDPLLPGFYLVSGKKISKIKIEDK